jgi:hypothetical protein
MVETGDIEPMPQVASVVDVVAAIRSLTWARTPAQAVEHMPPYVRDRLRPDAEPAIRALVAHAATLTGTWRLQPPAEAAFLAERKLGQPDLEAVRELAGRLLASFLDNEPALAEATSDDDRRTAFYYAAALVKQQLALAVIAKARSHAPTLDGALSGPDRVRVEEYLLSRSMVGPVQTLERLMRHWRQLVESLEGDHASMMYEEYEQDLIARDLFEVALSLVAPDARAGLESQLDPLDRRFFAATIAVAGSHRPLSSWQPQRWWWFHLPRRPGTQFNAYVENVMPRRTADHDTPGK